MDLSNRVIIPMLSVHPDELYLYGKSEWLGNRQVSHKNSLDNLSNSNNHKNLSNAAKKKATRAIKYMLLTATDKKVYNTKFNSSFFFKVAFITLTLPSEQLHSDQEIKSLCLNQFLTEARKKWGLTNYVWKAERQLNGNLHFHILLDKFIPYSELRSCWNRITNKLGYVDRFEAKHHKRNPNSTDIHSLWKIKDVSKYVCKYMTKKDKRTKLFVSMDNVPIENYQHITKSAVSKGAKKYLDSISSVGRIWACSVSLSNLTGGSDIAEDCYISEINSLVKNKAVKCYKSSYVSCYYYDSSLINQFDTPNLYGLLQSFVTSKFGNIVQEADIIYNYPYK